MIVLTAFFRTPDDPAAFDAHYTEIHSPLIQKIPGLVKMDITRFSKMITPPTAMLAEQPYLLCNMYFTDKDSFKAAMASEENKAAGADLMGFAGPLVSMCIGASEDIPLTK